MKLYLYNEKEDEIISSLDLGEISPSEENNLMNIISFLETNNILNRYAKLEIASNCETVYDELGFSELNFS